MPDADPTPSFGRESGAAVRDLLELIGSLHERFASGDPNLPDETSVLEAYKWIFSILNVGTDVYLWGDTQRPRFVDIVGPYKKWGGDNADAFYQFAPIDPTRTYRVTGRMGDAVYWSLTVYGGPDDGRYSERIVGSVNDRDDPARLPAGGGERVAEIIVGPGDDADLRLEADAVAAITRDYLVDPVRGRRMEWSIECLDGAEAQAVTDADLARRFRAVRTWIEDQAKITPLTLGEPNVVQEPYPVPKETFGWAAGDASYAMGAYALGDDEALVIRGRSPECAFWNLCLWNRFLHTYNSDYDRVTINGGQVHYEDDGSWTIVVSARDPGHPNWIATQGHPEGMLWFRWFYPVATPERPTTEVVPVGSPI
ncbi:MAG: DUF1214 domain-containing protein [Acidimicrobiia bacterium]